MIGDHGCLGDQNFAVRFRVETVTLVETQKGIFKIGANDANPVVIAGFCGVRSAGLGEGLGVGPVIYKRWSGGRALSRR
jgi:hypothetical protein